MGSRSRAPTEAPRDALALPRTCTSTRPMVCRSRATPLTLRDAYPSPLPRKGIHDATVDLPVAGAAPRLNIQGSVRYAFH